MSKQVVPIKSTEFVPMNEFVLVKPSAEDKSEKVTAGGIIIPLDHGPKSAMQRETSGNIIAIGSEVVEAGILSVDDFIMWPMTDGIEFEFTDGDFLLLRSESIIGFKKSDG